MLFFGYSHQLLGEYFEAFLSWSLGMPHCFIDKIIYGISVIYTILTHLWTITMNSFSLLGIIKLLGQ